MPFTVWGIVFILIPLFMIFYYGLIDTDKHFTLANITAIAEPEHLKALGLSIVLSLIATIICLVLAYPLAIQFVDSIIIHIRKIRFPIF